jgi:hypothetical protein
MTMGIAKQERIDAMNGKGPLGKAAPDEPVFILRAQVKMMPSVVQIWTDELASLLGQDHPKVKEARELLEKARFWQAQNPTKYAD